MSVIVALKAQKRMPGTVFLQISSKPKSGNYTVTSE